ncbi:MAG TPA: tetratricopeptide repeat protein [Pyrinomonadaceae bacterium]
MNSHHVLPLLLFVFLFLTSGVCFAQNDNITAGTEALENGRKLSDQGSREGHLLAIEEYEKAAKFFQAEGIKVGESLAYFAIASSYNSLNQYPKALDYAKRALTLMEGEENTDPTILASMFNVMGGIYTSVSEYEKALEYYNRALPLAQKENNPLLLAPTLTGMGVTYIYLGETKKGAEYLDQAISLFKRANNLTAEATTRLALAAAYSRLGEQSKSLEQSNLALPLMKQAGDHGGQANALMVIASIYDSLGEKQKSINIYNDALALTKASDLGGTHATILNNLGQIYSDLGDTQKAFEYFNESLKLERAMFGIKGGATSLNNIALLHRSMSEYQKALDLYLEALKTAQADRDIVGEAGIMANIGVTYLSLDNQRKALDYFQKASATFERVGDRESGSTTLNLLGAAHESLGEKQKALEFYNQALELGRAVRNPVIQANALGHMGVVYANLGENSKALDYYNQALKLIEQTKSSENEAPLLHNIGVLYTGLKEYPKALDYYERALSIQRSRRDRSGEASTLASIGAVYQHQDNYEKTLYYLEKAIEIEEKIRTEARLEEFKIKLADQSLNVYVSALLASVRLGRFEKAFELSEQARARAFLDQMGNARVDVRKGADENLIRKEQALRLELASLQRQLSEERAKTRSKSGSEAAEALEKQLVLKRVEYEDLITELKLKTPEYASILSVEALKVPAIQALLDKDTTLISYFVTLNETVAFVITHNSFHAELLPITGDNINTQLVRFRGFADLNDPYPQPLKELYRMLISPLEGHIKTRRVGIISHNILHYLPFSALIKGERYFGDDRELFYLPSASVLRFAQQPRSTGTKLLAFAQGRAEGLAFLPFAVKSAHDVAKLYGTAALTDAAATETSFRERIPTSNIVFVAAHGKLNTVTPLFSQIVLARDEKNDGLLEVHEIYGLDLRNVSLVVLSACQTELGSRSNGDDIVGLNRAFMYAGTGAVVTTLWNVKEKQSGELMVSFFKNLSQGTGRTEALQKAQREIRTKYPHPYYWAGFMLTGAEGMVAPK